MNVRALLITGAVTAGLALAGCTNNPSRKATALTVGKQILQPGGKKDTSETYVQRVSREAATALENTDLPVGTVLLPARDTGAVLVRIETNGPYGTWGTGDRSSITMRDGMITATRGLGDDLMSSDIDGVLSLVAQRSEGTAERVQRFLDGENKIYEVRTRCRISVQGSATRGPTMVREACRGDDVAFENRYAVNAAGQIVESKQWINARNGHAVVKRLR